MQEHYSLIYVAARDGRLGSGGNADISHIGSSQPLTGASALDQVQPPSGLNLRNVGLELNGLALSLGLLRSHLDALNTRLSVLNAFDARPVKAEERADSRPSGEQQDKPGESPVVAVDLRLTREAMTLGDGPIFDLAGALRSSGNHLSYAKADSDVSASSIKLKRDEYSESKARLSNTLGAASVWLEAPSLNVKSAVVDGINTLASRSPAAADAVKTVGAVAPSVTFLASEAVSGLWDTIKSRVSGNLIDKAAGKLGGPLGDLLKDKGKDASCCCPDSPKRGALDATTARLPESVGGTVRKTGKARSPGTLQPRRVGLPKPNRPVQSRLPAQAAQPARSGKRSDLNLYQRTERVERAPALTIKGEPLQPFSQTSVARSPGGLPGSSLAPSMAPPASKGVSRRGAKGLATGLSGAMSRLESVATRRLTPLRVATATMEAVQGVRDGDIRAVSSGLGTAGGAWAGASAGAALGTLIFPGVGTAVGGALGGLLGSEAGAWMGDKLGGLVDRLRSPEEVGTQLTSAPADNRQIHFAPVIQISGQAPASAQELANLVIQTLQNQCMPMLTDSLAVRRNAALTDGGD
ncbi:phage tail tape measure protein [Pseudomonas mucidolens]|uniref:phage tail tape measure protein n=1 Tax=Pseudomonas mucidolens TaxID=46679 RepID=UPI0030D84D65